MTSELEKSMDQEHAVAIKNQAIKTSKLSSDQVHFLAIKNLGPGHKCFNRQHIGDYSL